MRICIYLITLYKCPEGKKMPDNMCICNGRFLRNFLKTK